MKVIYLLTTILMIQTIKLETGFKCFFYFEKSFSIYNIKNLLLENESQKELPYTYNSIEGRLLFNICDEINIPEECKEIQHSSVLFISNDGKTCQNLIPEKKSEKDITLLDADKVLDGIQISKKATENFKIKIRCPTEGDADKKNPNYEIDSQNNLLIVSKDACGISNEAARVLYNNKYFFCGFIFLIGIILLLIGGYKWDTIFTAFGFLVGFGAIYFIFWIFVKYEQTTTSYIVISVIALIVGVIMACLCRSFTLLSYVLIGFCGGYFISKYLLITLQFVGEDWEVYLITLGAGCVLAGICAFVREYVVAIITAILGSFFVCYSIGFVIGCLENFFDILERIKSGSDLSTVYYIFFGLFVIFSILGMFLQFKLIHKERVKNDHPMNFASENLI